MPSSHIPSLSILSRVRGSLLGLAVGDALGAPVEFTFPGRFVPVTGMRGGGRFRLPAGYWTDDTSMALCLAESLIACRGFDAADQLERYAQWLFEGRNSSRKHAFGVGQTTLQALSAYRRTKDATTCGRVQERSAGNGSLMRLAPVPLFYRDSTEQTLSRSGEASRLTHALPVCVDACRLLGGLIHQALRGAAKEELYLFAENMTGENGTPLHPDVAAVAGGSFLRLEPPDIEAAGHVAKTLEAALWAFSRANTFEEGALLAVNLGRDADTVGAVYGQLAGAYWGEEAVPNPWLEVLYDAARIRDLADRLFHAGRDRIPEPATHP